MLWSDTGLPNTLLTNGKTPSTVFYVTQALNTPGGTLKGYEISLQKPFTFLTDEFDSKWDDSNRQSSEEYVHFGRQFYLGASYKF